MFFSSSIFNWWCFQVGLMWTCDLWTTTTWNSGRKIVSMYLRKLLKGLWHSVENWAMCAFRQRERENRKREGRETRGAEEARVEFALKGGYDLIVPQATPPPPISYPLLRKEKMSLEKLKTYNINGLREAEIESLTLGGLIRVNRLWRANSVHTGSQLHSLSPAATHQRCQLAYQLSPKPCRAAASLAGCCGLICHFISWWIVVVSAGMLYKNTGKICKEKWVKWMSEVKRSMRNPFEVGRTVRVACSALWLLETMYLFPKPYFDHESNKRSHFDDVVQTIGKRRNCF